MRFNKFMLLGAFSFVAQALPSETALVASEAALVAPEAAPGDPTGYLTSFTTSCGRCELVSWWLNCLCILESGPHVSVLTNSRLWLGHCVGNSNGELVPRAGGSADSTCHDPELLDGDHLYAMCTGRGFFPSWPGMFAIRIGPIVYNNLGILGCYGREGEYLRAEVPSW